MKRQPEAAKRRGSEEQEAGGSASSKKITHLGSLPAKAGKRNDQIIATRRETISPDFPISVSCVPLSDGQTFDLIPCSTVID